MDTDNDDNTPAGVNPFPEERARLWFLPVKGAAVPYGFEFPSLDRVQAAVDGYAEAVPVSVQGKPATLFVNEDGQAFNLPANELATVVLVVHNLATECRARVLENGPGALKSAFMYAMLDEVLGPALLWLGPIPPEARV